MRRSTLALFLASHAANAATPPPIQSVRENYARSEISFVDRDGELLQELRFDQSARRLAWAPLSELSPALREAVILAEDRRFEAHSGVDWLALGSAAWESVSGNGRRGASTITMQLAGLLHEELQTRRGGRSLLQKWEQIREAREIEKHWSKKEILEAYLNLVSWRGELQGIQAASMGLFGKFPHGINRAEALLLAALLRSPNASAKSAAARACALAKTLPPPAVGCAEIQALALSKLGRRFELGYRANLAQHVARRALAMQPTQISAERRLTIKTAVQSFALETLQAQLSALENKGVRDGAVLVIDNPTGEVIAYVANGGAAHSSAMHVDGVQAHRQAGSSLKPFLYGLALERNLVRPETLIDDSPVDIPVGGGSVYHPLNYDRTFHGPVSVAMALGSSLNVPAVRTLLLVGVDPFHGLLTRLGFGDLREPEYYGPSLALGAVDVSLWDLTNAYRTLAREGMRSEAKILMDQPTDAEVRVLSKASARLVTEILAAPENRAASFGFDSPLNTRSGAAVKTGTSKDMRDNWCVGYTKRYTVGVWIGNFRGEPMQDVSGVTGAGPVWSAMMTYLQPDGVPRVANPATSRVALPAIQAEHSPRIVYPAAETIFALDPDIPKSAQKMLFEASNAEGQTSPIRWTLDGAALEPHEARVIWEPRRGRHKLALLNDQGKLLDQLEFVVR